jgi:hypothetical protein
MRFATPFVIAASLVMAMAASAKTAPADAPAGSTALCKDGSYFAGAEKKGACSGHKGIKDWYGDGKAEATGDTSTDAAAKAKADAKAEAKAAKAQAKADAKAKADAAKAEAKDKAAAVKPAIAAPAAAATAGAATAAAAPAAAAKKVSTQMDPETLTAAAGGGPGLVWVNESTKVYHCQGDRWYGKTKKGAYLPEAEAESKGFKADHGKTCGK